ncbi:MAG: ComEC/Rec2 family competence protein [Acidimicrobiales bacterium]
MSIDLPGATEATGGGGAVRAMSDGWVHVLAAAVVGGALLAVGGPWFPAAIGLVAALVVRRPALLCLAAFVLASVLSARAQAAVEPIPASSDVAGDARLLTDPEPVGIGVRVDALVDGHHAEAWAYGAAAARLRDRLAGQVVHVAGELRPAPTDAPWLRARGVVARLSVDDVGRWSPGAAHHRIANAVRGLLVDGASSLHEDEHALFTGVVFGDDRNQSAVVADDFRAAGLTHLLAVSGQNVAFVLALSRPLIMRLRIAGRWVAVLAVLGLFATITRFEASVLRATVMAAIAATADLMGREISSRRVLSLAVAGLVLYRPLLVLSVAFQLSVAATAGIVWLAGPFARRFEGAGFMALPLAVTVTAQLAVAPVLVATFGTVSLVSLPANLLAGPAAGAMMTWGVAAGLAAGVAPSVVAAVLHVPTRVLAWWLHTVASTAAGLPVGTLGVGGVWVLVVAATVWHLARPRTLRLAASLAALAVVLAAVVSVGAPADGVGEVGRDSSMVHADGVTILVVGPRTSPEDLAEHLRTHRVGRVDLVVIASGGSVGRDHLEAVTARAHTGIVWGRSGHRIPSAVTPTPGSVLRFGPFEVTVTDDDPLDVTITGPRVDDDSVLT